MFSPRCKGCGGPIDIKDSDVVCLKCGLVQSDEMLFWKRRFQAFQGGEFCDKPILFPHLFSGKAGNEEHPSMNLSTTKNGRVAGAVWLEKEMKKLSRKRKKHSTTL